MVEHYDFIFVGRPGAAKETFSILREDYLKRLKRYVHVREHWVREQGVSKEHKDILAKSEDADVVVVLDEKGKGVSSKKLAQRLGNWRDEGRRRIAFVVGGADGLSKELKAKATWVLSLSELTLPHRLAHVVLLEQLYRAHTIIKGEPYHRE